MATTPVMAFAAVIASRREQSALHVPSAVSAVLVTVNPDAAVSIKQSPTTSLSVNISSVVDSSVLSSLPTPVWLGSG